VVGLVCALGGSGAAQGPAPAAGAASQPNPNAKAPAPKKAPKAPKAPKKGAAPVIDVAANVAALWGQSNESASKAAEALGTSTEAAAHEALLDALAMGMPPQVAIATLQALTLHPAPGDVTAIVRYANHHSPSVRGVAYGALASYPSPEAKKALVAGLSDMNGSARGAAAMAASKGRVREAIEPLFELLGRSEDSASKALAAMADPDLARRIGDLFGKVPEAILAATLGAILKRADFGPDPARVDLVRAIGRIQDAAAVSALTDYLDATPKNPPRPSRQEAQKMVEARLGGGK